MADRPDTDPGGHGSAVPGSTALAPQRICTGCGRCVWREPCCYGRPCVDAVVHFVREASTRRGAWRRLCRTDMRDHDFNGNDLAEINCEKCLAVLERERLVVVAASPTLMRDTAVPPKVRSG